MKRKTVGLLLMVLAAVTLAFATILMKLIPQLTSLPPAHVAIWRFSIAAPLLWVLFWFKKFPANHQFDHIWGYMGLGLVYALANFCALFALSRLPSSLYVIIVYIYPSLVVLVSLLIGRTVPKLFWLGLPLTFIGLFFTAYDAGTALTIDPIGFVITLVNAMAMAVYMLLSEKIFNNGQSKTLGTKWVLTGAMMAGMLMIPFLGISAPDSLQGWILLLSFGILGTLVPILAMNVGLQMLGAARGSVVITLQPVMAVLFSTIFLNETLSVPQWVGGILVVTAVILLQLSSDRIRKEA